MCRDRNEERERERECEGDDIYVRSSLTQMSNWMQKKRLKSIFFKKKSFEVELDLSQNLFSLKCLNMLLLSIFARNAS